MLYDYIFYKGYQLAKKSKNWNDTPVLFATIILAWCIILNTAALLFFLMGLAGRNAEIESIFPFLNTYRYPFAVVMLLSLWFYYSYGGRWKRIIDNHEMKKNKSGIRIHPAIVIISAYVGSFLLVLIAGMYKNQDGIFK